jgi:hypothetical protein
MWLSTLFVSTDVVKGCASRQPEPGRPYADECAAVTKLQRVVWVHGDDDAELTAVARRAAPRAARWPLTCAKPAPQRNLDTFARTAAGIEARIALSGQAVHACAYQEAADLARGRNRHATTAVG